MPLSVREKPTIALTPVATETHEQHARWSAPVLGQADISFDSVLDDAPIYFLGSSEKSVGLRWLGKVSHCVIEGDFRAFERPKPIALSECQFQTVV